jgi:hypothetical protein
VDIGGQVTLVAAAEKELEDCASAFSAEVSGQATGLCLHDVGGSTPITGFNVVNHVLSFSVGRPVLCYSFAEAGQGLSLQLFNTTDEVAPPVLPGIESLSYEVASKTLVVKPVDEVQAESAFPFLQCHQISAPVAVNAAPLFASGFEGQAATGYSLSVMLTDLEGNAFGLEGERSFLPSALALKAGRQLSYKIRIRNEGAQTVSGAILREHVPTAGLLTPFIETVSDVDWLCEEKLIADAESALMPCQIATPPSDQVIDGLDVEDIAPGQERVFTVTRKLSGSAVAGENALLGAAVFVPPTVGEASPTYQFDASLGDNVAPLQLNVKGNVAPTIQLIDNQSTREDVPTTPISVVIADEDDALGDLIVTATSSNQALVPNANLVLSGTGGTRALVATPALDQSGTATVTVTVSDGLLTATQPFDLVVTPVNDAPRVVSPLPDVTRAEGSLLDLATQFAFSDPEGDSLNYSISGQPANVIISPSSGVVVGNLSLSSAGVYPITVTVTEVGSEVLSVSDTFQLTVTNTNQNPTLVTPIGDQSSNEGQTDVSLSIVSNFTDADPGDVLTYTLSAGPLPPGLSLAPSTGLISGTISQTAANGSPYSVTILAEDGQGGSVTDTFMWNVAPVNAAPVAVGTLPSQSGIEGQLINIPGLTIRNAFSDPDGVTETLTYTASGLPSGVVISPTDGTVIGVPASGTSSGSPYSVVVRATDSGGLFADQPFEMTIASPPQ